MHYGKGEMHWAEILNSFLAQMKNFTILAS